MHGMVAGAREDAALVTGPHGRPRALHWCGDTYRVTDSPTPLEDTLGDLLTHPLPVLGWRFQGTSVHDGSSLVFDVVACGAAWHVVRTYA